MDYSKVLVKGNVADLMTMFPSADGEQVLKNLRQVVSGSATWRWRLVCQDGNVIDNVVVNQPTATFVYHGGDKYRRGTAENEDGLVIEIAFRDTKHNKDVYNTNGERRMPFSWLRPRMKGVMLAQYRYTPPDIISTEVITKQIRFVPTKVLYVGISSTMKRNAEHIGRMTIVSTATISPTKSDTTPTALPVEYYPHVRWQKDGDDTYHYVDAESAFSDLTSSHVIYGVDRLKFVLGDGTSLSMERFGGYGEQGKATLKRFFKECQTALVACEFKSIFRNGKEYDEGYASRFAYVCPLVMLPDMTEHEGQTPLPCPVLQAQRERRGALKKELTEYVFSPDRMFRLHGETFVDVLADCY